MISGGGNLDAAGVLAAARGFRRAADAAEAGLLAQAVEWAHLHTVTDLDDAATWWSGSKAMGQDTGIPIAGDGCPLVSEFAVAEFATTVGMSQESGRHYLGQALELAHRLPKLWARVQDGSLAAWRARRVAEHTLHLSEEAAAFVDQMVAPFAHKTGLTQTQRVVDEAIARYMPDLAREQADRSAEQRYLTIDHQQVSFTGTSRVHGELDLADALDLEDAIRAGAEQLKALGNDDPLDVRRAAALGVLARGQQAIDFEGPVDGQPGRTSGGFEARCAHTSTTQDVPQPRGREVVIYAHVPGEVFEHPDTPVFVENAGGRVLTAAQIAAWCRAPETTRVTVKKVVDLNQHIACTGYTPSDELAELVRLRDRTCVFPHCTKPARICDLDHIVPHAQGGETSSRNLVLKLTTRTMRFRRLSIPTPDRPPIDLPRRCTEVSPSRLQKVALQAVALGGSREVRSFGAEPLVEGHGKIRCLHREILCAIERYVVGSAPQHFKRLLRGSGGSSSA